MTENDKTVVVYNAAPETINGSLGCRARRVRFTSYGIESGAVVGCGVAEVSMEPQTPEEIQRAAGYGLPVVFTYYAWDGDRYVSALRPFIIRPEDKAAVIAMEEKRHGKRLQLLTIQEVAARLREGGAVI